MMMMKGTKKEKKKRVKGKFIPTAKNKPAENFLLEFGFKKQDNVWIYKLNNEIKSPNHLKVETE